MYTQRMGSTAAKSNIIDHHRSVNWSETEYANLVNVVQKNESMLRRDLGSGQVPIDATDSNAYLFYDYCNMLHPSPFADVNQLQRKAQWNQ